MPWMQPLKSILLNYQKPKLPTSIQNRGALVLVKTVQKRLSWSIRLRLSILELCLDDAELEPRYRHAGAILWGVIRQKRLVIIVQGQTTSCQRQAQHVFIATGFMIFRNVQAWSCAHRMVLKRWQNSRCLRCGKTLMPCTFSTLPLWICKCVILLYMVSLLMM